jgi:GTPase SAR1 family protein
MIKMASKTQCTVVVIGDTKTGKTALIQRLTHDKFIEVRQFMS